MNGSQSYAPELAYLDDEAESDLESHTVLLALQGGASLGAYTWGVLDALLDDGRLEFEGVSGASAGAINAVALASGLAVDGRRGAQRAVRRLWETFADEAAKHHLGRLAHARGILRAVTQMRASDGFYGLMTNLVADFRLDPRTMEPLRSSINSAIDFDALSLPQCIDVFVNATDVESGELRIFDRHEVDLDVVCASSAVPMCFSPVEVRGRYYWDGGMLGNPAIYPLIYGCRARDIILIETLSASAELPRTSQEVLDRALHIADHAGLLRELRSIKLVTHLLRQTPIEGMREIRVHQIAPSPELARAQAGQAFRADHAWFDELHEMGRAAGFAWLDTKLGAPPSEPAEPIAVSPLDSKTHPGPCNNRPDRARDGY